MINLIPIEERKRMIKDFYFRFFTVLFIILGLSMVVASIVFLPSYFFSIVKKNSVDQKLEIQKKEPVPQIDEETLSQIQDLRNKLSLVEKAETSKFSISEKVISEIVSKKMPDIKINHISYENDPVKKMSVKINGVAPSRERLLLFRNTLEQDPLFSEVNLPISNFIKGSNIEFYLDLIPK